jgi:hypothetical protein
MKLIENPNAITVALLLCFPIIAGCAPARVDSTGNPGDSPARHASESDECIFAELRALGADVTIEKNQLGSPVVSVDLMLVPDVTPALRLVAQLPRVDRLNLLDADLDVTDVEQLARLETLRWLDLSNTAITDEQLDFLASTPRLEFLLLWGTSITDQGLPHIARLSRLQKLDLSATKITSRGLAQLAELHELLELYVESPGIDEAQVKQLQDQLPNTLIVH